MGVYDREYIRRDGSGFWQSFTGRGAVCKWLIVLNVAAYVLQLVTADGRDIGWFTRALWLDSNEVLHGQVWRLVTYAFLHDPATVWHILFNMLFLWWFGHEMEDVYGAREFLTFYLAGVLAGALAFLPWGLGKDGAPCLGASGAVTAVMVLYALHFPRRVIYIWFVLPVPIWLFVAFQVGQDAFVFVGRIKTTTAVAAHLGGAAFALAYYKFGWRLSGLLGSPGGFRGRARRPRLRVYRDEEPELRPERREPRRESRPEPARQPAPVGAATAAGDADDRLEERVDAVLEKVARHGRDSLTESEKALLVHASEVYKRRRS